MAAKAQVIDVKHIVMTIGDGNFGSDTEQGVRDVLTGYFKEGWDLFQVFYLSQSKIGISNEYILVKYA